MADERLNRNNFLRWFGDFSRTAGTNTAVNDAINMDPYQSFLAIPILGNDVSTYGINTSTVNILSQANPTKPAEWDPVAKVIRFYAPRTPVVLNRQYNVPGIYVLTYNWVDRSGSESTTGTVTITVVARVTDWKGYDPSYACQKTGADNTGYGFFSQLQKYYIDNGEIFNPLTLKANVDTDPDYIAPQQDLTACPLPSQLKGLKVTNLHKRNILQTITFKKTGFADEVFNIQVAPISTKHIKIVGGLYNSVEIVATNTFNPPPVLQINPGPGGSVTVDSAVASGGPTIFTNVTFGTVDPGEILLF